MALHDKAERAPMRWAVNHDYPCRDLLVIGSRPLQVLPTQRVICGCPHNFIMRHLGSTVNRAVPFAIHLSAPVPLSTLHQVDNGTQKDVASYYAPLNNSFANPYNISLPPTPIQFNF